MNNKERLRALMSNLKNHDFKVNPTFKLEIEDAIVLVEMLKEYNALKIIDERTKKRNHEYYLANRDYLIEKGRERRKRLKEERVK